MEKGKFRISYVKKPMARRSLMAIGLSGAGLFLLLGGMTVSVNSNGQAGLNIGAVGFCSILFNILGMWYGVISFLEKEKNYLLARLSLGLGGLQVFTWILIIIIGIRS